MNREIPFNVNQKVKVKLNENGINLLIRSYSGLPIHSRPTEEAIRSRADKDGYFIFLMWEFMNLFGSSTYNGMAPLFEPTVIALFEQKFIVSDRVYIKLKRLKRRDGFNYFSEDEIEEFKAYGTIIGIQGKIHMIEFDEKVIGKKAEVIENIFLASNG